MRLHGSSARRRRHTKGGLGGATARRRQHEPSRESHSEEALPDGTPGAASPTRIQALHLTAALIRLRRVARGVTGGRAASRFPSASDWGSQG